MADDMTKPLPDWYAVTCKALTAHPDLAKKKTRLRTAATGTDMEALQGWFILWVLRELLPPCPEAEAVALLWDRRMAGDEPTSAEWHEVAEAARLAALDQNAGDTGYDAARIARSPALSTPEGQRGVLLLEPTLDQGALQVFKIAHGVAKRAAHNADTCDAAWSAALVHRPDAMRGVVTSAGRTGADVGFTYRVMGEKLEALLAR